MAERPPATDLRGGNTSEDSLSGSTANLVVAYGVDSQFDLLSGVDLESMAGTKDPGKLLLSLAGADMI